MEFFKKGVIISTILLFAPLASAEPTCSLPLQENVIAHSGGTDASGCHHNISTGGYHCHGGGTEMRDYLPNIPPQNPFYRRTNNSIPSTNITEEPLPTITPEMENIMKHCTIWIEEASTYSLDCSHEEPKKN